ncbi:hypothetical protein A2X44_00040 [candidate division CPR3 bacterium GWF2_35_18]|uniref:HAD-superfamily hydrolase, subfamily IA, variant 3 n=1 Tax=candidate division CPR3 bacterium GW2011_GWF2_35_18 TaxID=1618350 RepID=A0A0G0BL10_UNCC3|nr:MAG: HAD-superfamily hydrolase, subfamily IA, variant 3 [candidate division CPR3 bacterium GW2011_GWF2_35_18]KKP85879.1 MAG: HAD-superfamily hydrolase, subfamily IA, variant 3 [candidate division CPR3 bacterium GW2011_GWE2_35_7]OGB63315.1 MAG: hypothetical protein A2X44_00040 [candidate division CPR3 bacterium GWF2_35_18]OGB65616.1 MAG: hypothetical protein A2250_02470 [candidate division CPR3 bacterium RIFOXYA2_FULL_35_13]OGB76746.1 MAG: hypothetical protein A2476_01975 [candidate division 
MEKIINRPKIKAIFFDLGEVVLTNDWTFDCPEKDQEFYEEYGIKEFSYVKNPYFDDFVRGKISQKKYWTETLAYFKAKHNNPQRAIAIQKKYQKAKPGMLKLLANLKDNGYRLAVISTITNELLEYKSKKFGLEKYFEEIITSGHTGYKKPDKEIYQIAMYKMKVSPQESLFVDDGQKYVNGAITCGMYAILFNGDEGTDQLKIRLKEYGVKL